MAIVATSFSTSTSGSRPAVGGLAGALRSASPPRSDGMSKLRMGAPMAGAIHDVSMISTNAVNLVLNGGVGPMASGAAGMGSLAGTGAAMTPAMMNGVPPMMPGAYGSSFGMMAPLSPYGMPMSPYAMPLSPYGASMPGSPLGFSSNAYYPYGYGGSYDGMSLTPNLNNQMGAPLAPGGAGVLLNQPDIASIFQGVVAQLGSIVKTSFLTSAIFSIITNGYALIRGRVSGKQTMANILVDTAAYTGIGTASTVAGSTIGGYLGTLIPVPIVGTLLGMGVGALVGLGLGWVYEKALRPSLTRSLGASFDAPEETRPTINWPTFGLPAPAPAIAAPTSAIPDLKSFLGM